MGEAKRRKINDPNYGKTPKEKPKDIFTLRDQNGLRFGDIDSNQRGLVISPPIEINGASLYAKSTSIDSQELRTYILFWDKLVWPQSRAVNFASNADEDFLENCGILERPTITYWGDAAQGIAETQINAFKMLDKAAPGSWSLAQGENSLLLRDRFFSQDRGALVTLHRAIPVPVKAVPLNDILEFREKRNSEMLRIRSEIEGFYSVINNSQDQDFEIRRHINKIQHSCADVIKLCRESKLSFRMADISASFEFRPYSALMAGIAGYELGKLYNMEIISSLITSAISTIKFNKDIGISMNKLRENPYRYVYQYHNELF